MGFFPKIVGDPESIVASCHLMEEDVPAKPSGKATKAQPASTRIPVSKQTNVKTKSNPTKAASKSAAVNSKAKETSMAPKASVKAPLKNNSPVLAQKNSVTNSGMKAHVAVQAAVQAPVKPVVPEVNPDAALLAPKTPARSNRGYRPGAVEATKTLAELSDEPIEFKVGDNAVYPGHGVGRVNAIETKEIAGTKLTFYSIQILDSGMKIMVPQANVKNVGLRPIISKEEATLVVSILKQTDVKIDNQTWNRRYREYMEKIKTGGVREIAEVLRDLFLLKVDKELSFGERKMLDTARSLLIKELILATGRDELMKEAEVKAILDLT